jgi:hypothetical protein
MSLPIQLTDLRLLLLLLHHAAAPRPLCAQVPSWVFTAQVSAFGAVLVLNIINLMFCSTPVQYNCNVLLALIHGVAFATDFLLELRATPVVLSWGGRL